MRVQVKEEDSRRQSSIKWPDRLQQCIQAVAQNEFPVSGCMVTFTQLNAPAAINKPLSLRPCL